MLNREVRLSCIHQLDALYDEYEVFSVGSDGCVHKLPDVDTLKPLICSKRPFKLVSPFIPQSHNNSFWQYLKAIAEIADRGQIDLVANDYGVLYELNRCGLSKHFNVWAGRLLEYSFSEVPYLDQMLGNEDISKFSDNAVDARNTFMRAVVQSSYNNPYKIRFLKKMHVIGIEGNGIQAQLNSLRSVHESGLRIALHTPLIIAAAARACQVSRFSKLTPPNCASYCDKVIKLKMKEVVPVMGRSAAPADNEAVELVPSLTVLGNVIHFESQLPPDSDLDFVDTIITDYRVLNHASEKV